LSGPAPQRGLLAWLAVGVRGMAMGIAELVPGVSGGTIAFVTGIYEELIGSLARLGPAALGVLWHHGWRRFWVEYNLGFLLMLAGCVLLVAEVFFPSGGILGLFSGISLLASIYFAHSSGGWHRGAMFAVAELILAPAALYVAFVYMPHTAIGRALLGKAPTSDEVLAEDKRHELVGRVGVARSKMLPAGSVEVDGRMIDAISQGQAIDPGQYVKVVEVRGNRVVVRRADPEERPSQVKPDDLLARPAEELGLEDFDFDNGEDAQPA